MKLKQFLNYPTAGLAGVVPHKGQLFGLELELEGRNVGMEGVATKGWKRTQDGSLRGESVEFIFAKPLDFNDSLAAVDLLFDKFANNGVQINDSIRTSTHVHVNFADKPVRQAMVFFLLFTMFEELLENYSGEDRRGNLFCLSSRRTETIIDVIAQDFHEGNLVSFRGDRYKYAACNLCTLYKFGTVEIRTMRGASSAEQVKRWLAVINDLYEYSLKVVSPVELIRDLSYLGTDGLLRKIFNIVNYNDLMASWPKSADLHRSVLDGARLIQMLAFEFEEDFVEGPQIKNGIPYDKGLIVFNPLVKHRWHVRGAQPYGYWQDGETSVDDRQMIFNAEANRFFYYFDDGRIQPCKWIRGPNGENEMHDDEELEDYEPDYDEEDNDED